MSEHQPLEEIGKQLGENRASLVKKYSDRIDTIENLKPVFVIVGVIGALGAALARLIPGELGLSVTIAAAVLACVSGAVVALIDRKKLEIGHEAKEAHRIADDALKEAMSRRTRVEELEAAAERLPADAAKAAQATFARLEHRVLAIGAMLEVVEGALLEQAGVAKTADNMLVRAIANIHKAVGYDGGAFTVTIFRKEKAAEGEIMRRIAAQWTDPKLKETGGRSWILGSGYTGIAWAKAVRNRRAEVVIDDATLLPPDSEYRDPDADPEREKNYRSIAAVPIRIGKNSEVWGVATATSDRAGVFDVRAGSTGAQNAAVIRDVARVASLLAGLKQE